MRREWIEIRLYISTSLYKPLSPSMRREWIEMIPPRSETGTLQSPSMRREWIEISCFP